MKTTTSFTIDQEILETAKQKFPGKLSGLVNDFLKNLISIEERDLESIDIQLEKHKLNLFLQELSKLKLQIKEKTQVIEKYEGLIQRRKEEELKKEKENIQKSKVCYSCGNIADRDYQNKPICKACFFNL